MKVEIFKNPEIQAEFNSKGYVVFDLLKTNDIDDLQTIYRNYFPDKTSPFYISTFHPDIETRKTISALTQKVMQPYLDELFIEFKFVVSVFAVKRAQNNSHFELHQDISVTDEEQFTGVSMWCPLQNVDKGNGALYVVPKSHLMPGGPRGVNVPTTIDLVREHIVEKYAVPVPMKAGQVIVWHHKLMHGSYPNVTGNDRLATVYLLIPKTAPVLMYYGKDLVQQNCYAAEVLKMEDGAYDLFDVKTKPVAGTTILRNENLYIERLSAEQMDELAEQIGFNK